MPVALTHLQCGGTVIEVNILIRVLCRKAYFFCERKVAMRWIFLTDSFARMNLWEERSSERRDLGIFIFLSQGNRSVTSEY